MNNYKMVIQYDGGRYKGWQRLGEGDNTIQGKLEAVLSELTGEKIEIIGCSRTDAGVHALSQTANFKTRKDLEAGDIKAYLNRYLPQDIAVLEVTPVHYSFHARYNAKAKTYLYRIWNKEYPNPFLRKYSMYVEEKLDITRMRSASRFFIGEHDFTAYSNAKTKKKSMVREIYSIDFVQNDGIIEIRISGNGFLYNMVRRIIGTLIEVGLGKIKEDSINDIMISKERAQAGSMADACGLFLEKIEY
jgi:tRNA pseudouridine38-40 synthase